MKRLRRITVGGFFLVFLRSCFYYPAPVIVLRPQPPPIVIQQPGVTVIVPPEAPTGALYGDPTRGRITNESRRLTFECWLDPAFAGVRPQGPPTTVLAPLHYRELKLPPGLHTWYCESTYPTHRGPQPGPVFREIPVSVGFREYLLHGVYGWEVILTARGGYDP